MDIWNATALIIGLMFGTIFGAVLQSMMNNHFKMLMGELLKQMQISATRLDNECATIAKKSGKRYNDIIDRALRLFGLYIQEIERAKFRMQIAQDEMIGEAMKHYKERLKIVNEYGEQCFKTGYEQRKEEAG